LRLRQNVLGNGERKSSSNDEPSTPQSPKPDWSMPIAIRKTRGIAPSGLAAITTTLLSVPKAGDHVQVTDNVYRPSRNLCSGMLARYGVEITTSPARPACSASF
jgi:Cys/Met metabolism PLP-dependent enzyme